MSGPVRPRRQTGRRGRRAAWAWLLAVVLAVGLFVLGVAVGEALHDNPRPGQTTTSLTTLGR